VVLVTIRALEALVVAVLIMLVEQLTQAAVRVGMDQPQEAQVLSLFAIQLHTLMQLHTHQPLKLQQTGIRFIPSLPLEQSPSKEQT